MVDAPEAVDHWLGPRGCALNEKGASAGDRRRRRGKATTETSRTSRRTARWGTTGRGLPRLRARAPGQARAPSAPRAPPRAADSSARDTRVINRDDEALGEFDPQGYVKNATGSVAEINKRASERQPR